jgi:hypothetical protein
MKENVIVTTQDWLKGTEGITSYYPGNGSELEFVSVVEPGQAINLPLAERARMNQARPGSRVVPERL